MKTIFDCETEIGTSEIDLPPDHFDENGESCVWRIYAHTTAILTRVNGMLKIEQRCFQRLGREVSDHPVVKSDLMLEPALDTEEASLAFVEKIHRQYIGRVRGLIEDDCPA
jgi:hypothetical protein